MFLFVKMAEKTKTSPYSLKSADMLIKLKNMKSQYIEVPIKQILI